MKVRKALYLDENDIKKYMEIRRKSLEEWEDYNLARFPEEEVDFTVKWYKMYEVLKNFYFLEDEFWKVIWYICIVSKAENYLQMKHNFYIWPIYIDRDFRGKWFWKKILLDSISEVIKEKNYDFFRLELHVNETSEIPKNLYKSVWFEEIWIVKNIFQKKDWTFWNCILMEKFIENKKS